MVARSVVARVGTVLIGGSDCMSGAMVYQIVVYL